MSVLDIGYLDPKMYVSVKKYHNREHRIFLCNIYIYIYIYRVCIYLPLNCIIDLLYNYIVYDSTKKRIKK